MITAGGNRKRPTGRTRHLVTVNNLAVERRLLGQYQRARQLDEDTLTRRWRVLGDGHPDTLLFVLTSSPIYALWVKTKRSAT
jgi:hypothetical protein